MKVLILTDIQYDFLPGGALAVPDGDTIIPTINELQKHFPMVVATQDWHPANHLSFASAHPGKKMFETIHLGDTEQILWPDHCVQGTKGAELAESLSLKRVAAIFRKGMHPEIDSYSTFHDNEYKNSTGLSDFLKGKGVKEVYIVGLAGDFCVGFSALDAIKEGFTTYVIEDGTKPIDNEGFKKMKAKITEQGGKFIKSSSIISE